MKTISQQGLDLIKFYEGFRAEPYQDSVGVWTIGYGTTVYPDGTKVAPDDGPVTKERAEELLFDHVNQVALVGLKRYVRTFDRLSQHQVDALASFVYNLGTGAFANSTLLRKLNLSHFDDAADEFKRWVYAGGKVLKGLIKRRDSEAHLYRTGELKLT